MRCWESGGIMGNHFFLIIFQILWSEHLEFENKHYLTLKLHSIKKVKFKQFLYRRPAFRNLDLNLHGMLLPCVLSF